MCICVYFLYIQEFFLALCCQIPLFSVGFHKYFYAEHFGLPSNVTLSCVVHGLIHPQHSYADICCPTY
jgi:hypothetical protein